MYHVDVWGTRSHIVAGGNGIGGTDGFRGNHIQAAAQSALVLLDMAINPQTTVCEVCQVLVNGGAGRRGVPALGHTCCASPRS